MEKSFKDVFNRILEVVKSISGELKVLAGKTMAFFGRLKESLYNKIDANKQRKETAKQGKEESESQVDWARVWSIVREIFMWFYRLRSILLSIPVMVAAVVLAVRNSSKLPEFVGLNMQATGEYATVISRNVAVMGPLALTAVCLLFVICSKKVLYPWLISVFSLALPLLFLFTSTFP